MTGLGSMREWFGRLARDLVMVLGCFAGPPAAAQIALDGTTGPAGPLAGPHYQIGAELGRLEGANLFHSFERFGLRTLGDGTTESATFSGPDAIAHVISRVTGGARSEIDGTIISTMPQADFWFINPAGVLFGPNASLDVQGSFHVSTADEIRFADGARFSATDPNASSFTVAAPEAFGFLGAAPGAITVDGGSFISAAGETLSLVGGGLDVRGSELGFIGGSLATFNLVAVAGPAEVMVGDGRLETPPVAELGPLLITDGALLFTNMLLDGVDDVARLRLRGDTIVIDGARLSLDNLTAQDLAGALDIKGRQILVRNSTLTADARGSGAGGTIGIEAGDILIIDGGSRLFSNAVAGGVAGGITLLAPQGRIIITDDSFVTSLSLTGGTGGLIRVEAGELIAQGDGVTQSGIAALSGNGGGNAGNIMIEAGSLVLEDGGVLTSTTSGTGRGGTIDLAVRELIVIGPLSRIDSSTSGDGDGGLVRIAASEALTLGPDGLIASATLGPGGGGAVEITTGEMLVFGASLLMPAGVTTLSGEPESGPAGRIEVTARHLVIGRDGALTASSGGAFDAGPIVVRITGGDLVLEGGVITNSTLPGATGAAGSIDILVERGSLIIEGGTIASNNRGAGHPGRIEIVADSILALRGSEIAAGTTAAGAGGRVRIVAAEQITLSGSGILTAASGTGDAGMIDLEAGQTLSLGSGSRIASSSALSGGGRIVIGVGKLIDLHHSEITTSVAGGEDTTAGNITIGRDGERLRQGAPEILIIDGSLIRANAPRGFGGNVMIVADNILVPGADFEALLTRGDIDATGGDPERDGTVVVEAPEVDLTGGLVVLESAFVDAGSLLRERCEARRDVGASSFTGVGRGGLPITPEGPLLSGYDVDSPDRREARGAGESALVLVNIETNQRTPALLALPINIACTARS